MTKRKIITAFFSLISLLFFALIMLGFLNIDITCNINIVINPSDSIMAVNYDDYCYINNHNIQKIKINHKKEKYLCKIAYTEKINDFYFYSIFLPSYIYKNYDQINCIAILNTVNIYQYIFD